MKEVKSKPIAKIKVAGKTVGEMKSVELPISTRTPITIVSTDWHLKESNIDQIKDLVTQKCELAKSLKIDTVFCLGDAFDARVGQKVPTLVAFGEILDIFTKYKIELWMIPGNHDKVNYMGFESYLEPYKHHPNFKYIDKAGGVPMGNIFFSLLPFFKESVWLENYNELMDYLKPFDKKKKYCLLSHTAMNGSTNNDGTKVSCGISVGDFKEWDLVLLGHYHDFQQIGPDIFHIPSIQQNNFGENADKGFIVIYNNLSFEIKRSKFKEYRKVVVDLDTTTKKQLNEIAKQNQDKDSFIRLEFIGEEKNVKALNKEEFTSMGFDIKIKTKEIEATIDQATQEIKEYNNDSIIDEFRSFCEDKERNFEVGVKYLNKKLSI